jgi:[ribosomal protein S5]-alanine N-acetyltransferase
MHPPEDLATERLRLRRLQLTDAPAIYATYATDPEVTRYTSWRPHASLRDAEEFVVGALGRWLNGHEFTWALVDRRSDRLLGACSVIDSAHGLELGYVLGRQRWGEGLMTEAVGAVRDWAATMPDVHRLWAYCDVDNIASARVLEKCGFEREGRLRRWAVHPNVSEVPRDAFAYSWVR